MNRTHQTAWGPVRQDGPWICVNDLLSWTDWWTVGTEAFESSISTIREAFESWARPDGGFRVTRCGVHCLDAIRMEGNEVWVHCVWGDLLDTEFPCCAENFEIETSKLIETICDEQFPDGDTEAAADSEFTPVVIEDDDRDGESWLPELDEWK